ncbi:MAG: CDP-diacylglycerol--glycerol-3-phosphate 3-phosphatidyltransferase [Candidatus Aenigmatarchaeota archaeon]
MNLPNKLTLLRIILIPFILFFLYIDNFYTRLFALVLFIIAVITDILDGIIAKKRKLKTKFGNYMDPIADKILVGALFIVFTELGLVPAWMTIIIISREFIISGIRSFAASYGKIIDANIWGKSKAASQMIVIVIILFFILIGPENYLDMIYILALITTILSLISILIVIRMYYKQKIF